jgi:hypothetical protein
MAIIRLVFTACTIARKRCLHSSRSPYSPRQRQKWGRLEGERESLYRGGDMATKASSTVSGAAYEEQRRKRVLENLKHLEVTIRLLTGTDRGSSSVHGSPFPSSLLLFSPVDSRGVGRSIC